MPILLIVRMPAALTRRLTVRFSSGMKYLCSCKLGAKVRRVFRLEWLTELPVITFFPVIWQIRDMAIRFRAAKVMQIPESWQYQMEFSS